MFVYILCVVLLFWSTNVTPVLRVMHASERQYLRNRNTPGNSLTASRSRIDCARRCVERPSCSSFVYNKDDKTCSTHEEVIRIAGVATDRVTGLKYYTLDGSTACPEDYIWVSDINFCFKHNKQHEQHSIANQTCYREGGYLVRLDTEVKQIALTQYLDSISESGRVWIQGFRNGSAFIYDDATSLVDFYTNWSNEEPDLEDDKKCGIQIKVDNSFQWESKTLNDKDAFVCEILL